MQVIDNAIAYEEDMVKYYEESIADNQNRISTALERLKEHENKLDDLQKAREVLRNHNETT